MLDDAVENIINLSPCRIGIRLPAEDDTVLCLVQYLSARHIKCITFQYDNMWHVYSKKLPTAVLLHNKSASTGISSDNFCAQGRNRRYILYDVNLFPP